MVDVVDGSGTWQGGERAMRVNYWTPNRSLEMEVWGNGLRNGELGVITQLIDWGPLCSKSCHPIDDEPASWLRGSSQTKPETNKSHLK